MTVLQAFMTIKDPDFKKFVFQNLDERYISNMCCTLSSALTYGVNVGVQRGNWERIIEYTKNLKGGNETPLHIHDCSTCSYLGTFKEYDLYHHEGTYTSTIIARYGQDSEYLSGLVFGESEKDDMTSPLGEAYRRSRYLQLIKK